MLWTQLHYQVGGWHSSTSTLILWSPGACQSVGYSPAGLCTCGMRKADHTPARLPVLSSLRSPRLLSGCTRSPCPQRPRLRRWRDGRQPGHLRAAAPGRQVHDRLRSSASRAGRHLGALRRRYDEPTCSIPLGCSQNHMHVFANTLRFSVQQYLIRRRLLGLQSPFAQQHRTPAAGASLRDP